MTIQKTALPEIAKWNIGGQEIHLLQFQKKGQDRLEFRINANKEKTEKTTICLNVDDQIPYVKEVVTLFHEVIEGFLSDEIKTYSFVPLLTTRAWIEINRKIEPLSNIRVALFGWGDRKDKTVTVKEACLAFVNTEDRTHGQFKIDDLSEPYKEILSNLLCHLHPVSSYNERSRAIVIFNQDDNNIKSISLELINPITSRVDIKVGEKAELDERHWAVTPMCTQTSSESGLQWCGHAMIAVEGVGENGYFLKYAHAVSREREAESLDNRKSQVLVERSYRNRASPGPTIVLPRENVEHMLTLINTQSSSGEKIPFALGRQIAAMLLPGLKGAAIVTAVLGGIAIGGAITLMFAPVAMPIEAAIAVAFGVATPAGTSVLTGVGALVCSAVAKRSDCLKWMVKQLPNAGIKLNLPPTIITPKMFIEYLNSHPDAVQLETAI